MGRPIAPADYGMPSKFEKNFARRRTDVFVNRQSWSDWSMTPLQGQQGIVTPNGVIFERSHAGTPDIDPATHRPGDPRHGPAAARTARHGSCTIFTITGRRTPH